MIILQGFKLLPCDGVEASHSPYRLIPTFPIVVQLVGGICQTVGRRRQFPALLQYLSHLVLFRFDLRVYQQHKNIIRAEGKCVCADTFHDVKDKFVYLYLQPIAVAVDNLTQGFGMQKRWSKPHTALFFGG